MHACIRGALAYEFERAVRVGVPAEPVHLSLQPLAIVLLDARRRDRHGGGGGRGVGGSGGALGARLGARSLPHKDEALARGGGSPNARCGEQADGRAHRLKAAPTVGAPAGCGGCFSGGASS